MTIHFMKPEPVELHRARYDYLAARASWWAGWATDQGTAELDVLSELLTELANVAKDMRDTIETRLAVAFDEATVAAPPTGPPPTDAASQVELSPTQTWLDRERSDVYLIGQTGAALALRHYPSNTNSTPDFPGTIVQ
jgi:hypothetical protein